MPNHFHLQLEQVEDDGISEFMRALSNAYTGYYNNRYERVGSLFQGKFKAAELHSEPYYLYLSKYIHENPKPLGIPPAKYDYSSCRFYVTEQDAPSWLATNIIKHAIGGAEQYRIFLTYDSKLNEENLEYAKID